MKEREKEIKEERKPRKEIVTKDTHIQKVENILHLPYKM